MSYVNFIAETKGEIVTNILILEEIMFCTSKLTDPWYIKTGETSIQQAFQLIQGCATS